MALTQISTAGVKNDAVTAGKIPANAVGSSELADNAVDTNAIQDDAVTADKLANSINTSISAKMPLTGGTFTGNVTSQKIVPVNDSQFDIGENATRFNNGYFDTLHGDGSNLTGITSTTINNNANNRIITGSDSANTLNGESLVTVDSNSRMTIGLTAGGVGLTVATAGGTYGGALQLRNTVSSNHNWLIGVGGGDGAYVAGRGLMIRDETTGANRIAISTSGKVGINMTNPDDTLDVNGTMQVSSNAYFSNQYVSGSIFLGGTGSANEFDDYEEGTYVPTVTGSGSGSCTLNASFNNMQYTKIGNWVHVTGRVRVVSENMSGTYIHFTLPFTSANLSEDSGRFLGNVMIQYSDQHPNAYVIHPQNNVNYVQIARGNTGADMASAGDQFSGNELISLAVSYRTT